MMSVDQYERLRGAAWDQLSQTLDSIGKQAAESGLTDVELDSLLASVNRPQSSGSSVTGL